MKLNKVLLTATAFLLITGAYSQTVNRTDLCQQIPDLTAEQSQKIAKLSATHQKTMDVLRTQFWSEPDVSKATAIKTMMNTEMSNHYNNITALLSPEQKAWFDQICYANNRRGYGRGQNDATGQVYGQGQALAAGQAAGYGRGYGRCRGGGYGAGYGRGMGRGYGRGRGAWNY